VRLTDAIEIDEFAVEIVYDFYLGWRLVKEYLSAARERLNVCGVLGDERKYGRCKTVFAADIAQWASHGRIS
jgi:hypothetical protein